MEEEIWKDIKGYENLYQISNKGRVKCLGNGGTTSRKRIMKLEKLKNGYFRVTISKDGKYKRFLVHRLVALHFISNPDNLPYINHKDENKENNQVKNLEWCSPKYNINYGSCKNKISNAKTNHPKLSKPIKCLDLKTNKVTIYPSIREATRQLNIPFSSLEHSLHDYKSPYKNRYIFTEIKE